jgi:hypothetical protein
VAEFVADWSRLKGELCIRISGCVGDVEVRPVSARGTTTRPPMAGSVVVDGDDRVFLPRFAFSGGIGYEVSVAGASTRVLHAPQPPRSATTEVVSIHPTSAAVPMNLLRFSVRFSQPMSVGYAPAYVHLSDIGGKHIDGALLSGEYELWDSEYRRLTVLLDPGRIKQGLADHEAAGYPLRQGHPFELTVDERFPDAHGNQLLHGRERRYEVEGVLSGRVDPAAWRIAVPTEDSLEPVSVGFDRTMDHALLLRCLRVVGPGGTTVAGSATPAAGERSWSFRPEKPWARGEHRLDVAPVLEDVAGNSVLRPFDRDLHSEVDNDRSPYTCRRSFWPT